MRALKAVLKVIFGLSLGVGLAEVAFSVRDHGAFPHVNFYVEDEALGVRLQPNATMQLQVAGNNPITTAATNSKGFRAPEWPEPTKGEVLVVGDSQVFGLGVEANETFSAKLSEQLGVPVLNAGVPTYGPREYTAMVKEVLAQRKTVGTVVYVLNLSNDLFEVDRPNVQRHKVWDGWAVRAELAPSTAVTAFPLRRQLMSRSHFVYGVRKLLHSGEGGEAVGTEGSWRDLAEAGKSATPPPADEAAQRLLATRSELDAQLEKVASQLERHLSLQLGQRPWRDGLKPFFGPNGDPGDIVTAPRAEVARRVDQTAYHLFVAAVGAARNEQVLEDLAKSQNDPVLLKLLEERRALRAKLDAAGPEAARAHPIHRVLLETKQLCNAAGAKLVVVALPLDVMVSPEEWKKYVGATPLDLSATKVLRDDLVARAERLGAIGLDPTDALAAAEPGAFLDADLHLTPKGHAALAGSLAAALEAAPKPKTTYALPDGRSWPPTEDEFRRADGLAVKADEGNRCTAKRVREWVRVSCGPRKPDDPFGFAENRPQSVAVLTGGHGDALAWKEQSAVVLVLPVLEGDAARVKVWWERAEQPLSLDWPKGGAFTAVFGAVAERSVEKAPKLPWEFQSYVYWEQLKTGKDFEEVQAESELRREAGDGGATVEPPCAADEVTAGARLRCASSCDAQHPCARGHCEPWPTGNFCAVP